MSESVEARKPSRWREALKVFAIVVPYMIPLFSLWNKTGFPDDLGVHIAAHGKAGVIESWWYSYLLIEMHRFWDVVTFIYMWAAVAGFLIWVVTLVVADRRSKQDGTQVDPDVR